jgi:hypothetical protein
LRQLPYDQGLGRGKLRSHLNRISAYERARQCPLRVLPHQQQLQLDDRADGLRELRLPFDEMAADDNPRTLDIGDGFCGDELRELPYDQGVGLGVVRPQHDWLYFDRHTRLSHTNALRVMPHQQQLHAYVGKHGLHWLPPL